MEPNLENSSHSLLVQPAPASLRTAVDYAIQYAAKGLTPFPCGVSWHLGQPKKQLRYPQRWQKAHERPFNVKDWTHPAPKANGKPQIPFRGVALLTGKPGGLFVVEVDSRTDFEKLIDAAGAEWPETVVQNTRQGFHLLFKWEDKLAFITSTARVFHLHDKPLDIDVRTNGGNIICEPTEYKSPDDGKLVRYTFEPGKTLFDREPAPLPDWLFDAFNGDLKEKGIAPHFNAVVGAKRKQSKTGGSGDSDRPAKKGKHDPNVPLDSFLARFLTKKGEEQTHTSVKAHLGGRFTIPDDPATRAEFLQAIADTEKGWPGHASLSLSETTNGLHFARFFVDIDPDSHPILEREGFSAYAEKVFEAVSQGIGAFLLENDPEAKGVEDGTTTLEDLARKRCLHREDMVLESKVATPSKLHIRFPLSLISPLVAAALGEYVNAAVLDLEVAVSIDRSVYEPNPHLRMLGHLKKEETGGYVVVHADGETGEMMPPGTRPDDYETDEWRMSELQLTCLRPVDFLDGSETDAYPVTRDTPDARQALVDISEAWEAAIRDGRYARFANERQKREKPRDDQVTVLKHALSHPQVHDELRKILGRSPDIKDFKHPGGQRWWAFESGDCPFVGRRHTSGTDSVCINVLPGGMYVSCNRENSCRGKRNPVAGTLIGGELDAYTKAVLFGGEPVPPATRTMENWRALTEEELSELLPFANSIVTEGAPELVASLDFEEARFRDESLDGNGNAFPARFVFPLRNTVSGRRNYRVVMTKSNVTLRFGDGQENPVFSRRTNDYVKGRARTFFGFADDSVDSEDVDEAAIFGGDASRSSAGLAGPVVIAPTAQTVQRTLKWLQEDPLRQVQLLQRASADFLEDKPVEITEAQIIGTTVWGKASAFRDYNGIPGNHAIFADIALRSNYVQRYDEDGRFFGTQIQRQFGENTIQYITNIVIALTDEDSSLTIDARSTAAALKLSAEFCELWVKLAPRTTVANGAAYLAHWLETNGNCHLAKVFACFELAGTVAFVGDEKPSWWMFDRTRWRVVTAGDVSTYVAEDILEPFLVELRTILEDSKMRGVGDTLARVQRTIKNLGQSKFRMQVVEGIQSERTSVRKPNSWVSELDRTKTLLAFDDGVVYDVLRNEVRRTKPEDMIQTTLHCSFDYDKLTDPAHIPELMSFISDIFCDKLDERDYLMARWSRALFGCPEQTMYSGMGAGSNGKSVLVAFLSFVLGRYRVGG
jgi:hypothetical protein